LVGDSPYRDYAFTFGNIEKFEYYFNQLQIQALKIRLNQRVRKNGSFIDIDVLPSLRFLEIEAKDFENIVTWDTQNIGPQLRKFHLRLTIKDYEFEILNKIPINRILSLHLEIKSMQVLFYQELIANQISKIPHVTLETCLNRSELI
jgi:hypothetical protein